LEVTDDTGKPMRTGLGQSAPTRKEKLMLTAQQVVNRSLECVWKLSSQGLMCFWIVREVAVPAAVRMQESAPAMHQRVA
jgi:hypothetical protein